MLERRAVREKPVPPDAENELPVAMLNGSAAGGSVERICAGPREANAHNAIERMGTRVRNDIQPG